MHVTNTITERTRGPGAPPVAPAAFPTCPDKSRGPRQASHERANNETMGEIKHGDITLFIPYNCWRACPAARSVGLIRPLIGHRTRSERNQRIFVFLLQGPAVFATAIVASEGTRTLNCETPKTSRVELTFFKTCKNVFEIAALSNEFFYVEKGLVLRVYE